MLRTNLFVRSMRQQHLPQHSHFTYLWKNKNKKHCLTWSFAFGSKSCFNLSFKRINQASKPEVKSVVFILNGVMLRTNVNIFNVSRSTKEHKNIFFCTKSLRYCYFLPHFIYALFDYWIQLTMIATCTIFSSVASLSGDLL